MPTHSAGSASLLIYLLLLWPIYFLVLLVH
uniref:Uncharacterized protein n=1 Tax=Anguilla anguilla TaxID=7936 RepID=A0A0E9VVP8_ANGAN